jgi:hypothetical protein
MSDHYEMIIGDLKDELSSVCNQLSGAIISYNRLNEAYCMLRNKVKRASEVLELNALNMSQSEKLKEIEFILKG